MFMPSSGMGRLWARFPSEARGDHMGRMVVVWAGQELEGGGRAMGGGGTAAEVDEVCQSCV